MYLALIKPKKAAMIVNKLMSPKMSNVLSIYFAKVNKHVGNIGTVSKIESEKLDNTINS